MTEFIPPSGPDWTEPAPGLYLRKGPDGKIADTKLSPERVAYLQDLQARRRRDNRDEREASIFEALDIALLGDDQSSRANAIRVLLDSIARSIAKDDAKSLSGVTTALDLLRAFPKADAPPPVTVISLDPGAAAFIEALWTDDPEEQKYLERFSERWTAEHKPRSR